MSIDNENDDMDAENPGGTGVATAPSIDDLDAAMAALIRAASPSESTQAQSAMEPARSGPAMALVNSVSIMDEDDDDFFDDDEEEETEEAQDQAAAPLAQRQQATPPAPIPFRAPQAQAEPQAAPAPMQYSQPPQPPQPAPIAAEYQQPVYTPPPQQAAPAPMQPEYSAPQPVQPEPQQYVAPQAAPQPVPQPQPLPQQATAPQTVAYQQPAAAPQPQAANQQQNSVSQHARATLMHETNQDKHLHDASKYIKKWLEENSNDEEVVEAAMDWARKHKNADHNGHVIASLLLLDNADNEVTVMAVRWLTHHSMHQLAPEIVAGLTRRQQ
ncbi:MAG TPA: hypothetical protein V6C89_00045 [Drouetiella sp.]|jgi:hypothetical protein